MNKEEVLKSGKIQVEGGIRMKEADDERVEEKGG